MKALSKVVTTKKGQITMLSGIALGIVSLVVIVGIGLVVLNNLAATQAGCGAFVFNTTTALCHNVTNISSNLTPPSAAYSSITYGVTQLGSTGLLGWLPAVIALIIGVFFLTYFAGKAKGKSY